MGDAKLARRCEKNRGLLRESVRLPQWFRDDRQQPVHYDYISRRLTREIVQQHEAARPEVTLLALLAPWLPVTGIPKRQPRLPQSVRPGQRARTVAVKDNTGTIDSPGAYVTATMNMRRCKVVFHLGFENSVGEEVAAFFADETVPDVGRVSLLFFSVR